MGRESWVIEYYINVHNQFSFTTMAGSPQQHTGMPNTFGVYCLTHPVGRTGVSGEHPQLLADHRLFSCMDLVDTVVQITLLTKSH